MAPGINLLPNNITGHGLSDGRCLPCSGVLGRASISSYSSHSNLKPSAGVKILFGGKSVNCSRRLLFTCAAGSSGRRRNPDFSRQNKQGQGFSRSKNRQDNSENLDESEHLPSNNGPLLSLSGNPRLQATATPGPREREIVQLFRKVQAQLRERAAIKEEKKIEAAQGQGERGTVDSLLKLLRKHSVEQGKKKSVNEDINLDQSEQNIPFDEEQNSNIFSTTSITRDKGEKVASSTRPASNFRRKSPVPRVKFQPIYSTEDATLPTSYVMSQEKGKGNRPTEVETEPFSTDVSDEMDETLSEISDIDEAEEERTETEESLASSVVDLGALKLIDLRAIAKSRGVKGYSRLKKGELLDLLCKIPD